MAEKILNTRIQLKYDSLANWQSSAFNGNDPTKYLKVGEVAVVQVETNIPNTLAPVMFKVGTGNKKFDDLDWASAKAADVYGWAKKSEEDFIAWAKTNVVDKATVVAHLTEYSTTEQMNAAIAVETERATKAEEALGERINALNVPEGGFASKTEFEALKGKVEDEDGALAKANSVAEDLAKVIDGTTPVAKATDTDKLGGVDAANYATKTEAQGYADAKDEAIQNAQNTATAAKNRIDAFIDGTAEAESAIDTLVEIQQYMTKDTEAFTALSSKVTNIENGTTVVPKATDAATLNGKADTAFATAEQGTKADNAAATIATYGDIVTHNVTEFQPAGSYQPAGNYKTIQEVVAETGAANQTLKISQDANGVITATPVDIAITANQVSGLATIATSGNVNDLVQTEGDVLVFNCGSASTVL